MGYWDLAGIRDGLVFGRDIVFHYGPLSYLVIRLPIGLPEK
jgi:hypothetical protein